MIRAGLIVSAMLATVLVNPTSTTAAATPTLVVTTQNVRVGMPAGRARHDIRAALTGSDLVITQEMGARIASRFAPPGVRTIQPVERSAAREYAIYYRPSKLRPVATFPILLHVSSLFRSATRYAVVVELVTRTTPTRCVDVVDLHMIPHIERAGSPRPLPRIVLVRRALNRVAGFVDVVRRGCALLVGGDWNVDGYADRRVRSSAFPFAHLSPRGLSSTWAAFPRSAPTLGARHVDGFYFARLRPISHRVIGGTYSDHNGYRLRFGFR